MGARWERDGSEMGARWGRDGRDGSEMVEIGARRGRDVRDRSDIHRYRMTHNHYICKAAVTHALLYTHSRA